MCTTLPPHVFISTCFSSLKRFANDCMMLLCLKSFKISNKGFIKNNYFNPGWNQPTVKASDLAVR